MDVTVSQIFMQMGEGDDSVEMPLSNEQIYEDMNNLEGINIVEQYEEATEEYTKFTTVLEFDDYSVLGSSDSLGDSKLEKDGRDWVYTVMLSEGRDPDEPVEEVDEQSMAMMKPYFEGYEIRFTVTAPKKIKTHNMGELSDDGKTVSYAIPTIEMQNNTSVEPLVLKVVW